ncbi:DUF5685 family protein [Methylomagnum sp.]
MSFASLYPSYRYVFSWKSPCAKRFLFKHTGKQQRARTHQSPDLPPTPANPRRIPPSVLCSLCHSLRRQFGLPASLLISHELTIGLLAHADGLAASLEYQPCPARLFCGTRPIIRHDPVDKAARMNLLLVWLKLVDWEADCRRF